MNVLIIGSGGREHVLAWKIKQNPRVKEVYCAPGNGGISQLAACVDIAVDDTAGLLKFAKSKKIDLTVVGPELSLAGGIVDAFEDAGLKIFGPSKEAAMLEGSKVFAKEFMKRYNIPTARFRTFTNINHARDFVENSTPPFVVKADGLAAGKGVIICQTSEEALAAINQIMDEKVFKEAGDAIVIEQCLVGEEASILAISDGEHYVILDSSQDHKRIFDDDLGPNTGGMGAYSPAPIMTDDLLERVDQQIIAPTIMGMKKEGVPFKGVLYVGVMVTIVGPQVLEYNVRFGDPESQAVLPRLKTDLVDIMMASCSGKLNKTQLEWDPRSCICVVMCSGGYPGAYEKGKEISGLDEGTGDADVMVFHAGTQAKAGKVLTAGGRVLGVTGLGDGIEDAIARTYKAVEQISFDHCFFRRDIGAKGLKRVKHEARLQQRSNT